MIGEKAWHSLFVRNMFVRPPAEDLAGFEPEFAVIKKGEHGGLLAHSFDELMAQVDQTLEHPGCCALQAQSFLDQHPDLPDRVTDVFGQPALIETWDQRFFYFVAKFECNFVVRWGRPPAWAPPRSRGWRPRPAGGSSFGPSCSAPSSAPSGPRWCR